MLRQMKHLTAMLAACFFGVYLSPAFANDYAVSQEPSAYGQFNASIGCDETADRGGEVSLLDQATRRYMHDFFEYDVQLGDSCPKVLAMFPPLFGTVATVAKFSVDGDSTSIPEYLIWVIRGPDVNAVASELGELDLDPWRALVCEPDGYGGLVAKLLEGVKVNGMDYAPPEGQSCMESGKVLRIIATDPGSVAGPKAVTLGEGGGGVLFAGKGPGRMELLECNVAVDGHLRVTFSQNEHGIDYTRHGALCMETLTQLQEATPGLQWGGPVPLTAGTGTKDPGTLVWVIRSGTVLE